MSEILVKAIKWYVVMLFTIVGSWTFFLASQEDNIKPVMIGVLCFGVVFIVFSFWKAIRGKILLATLFLLIGGAFLTNYVPGLLYRYADIRIDWHYTLVWAALMLFPGFPVMMHMFKHYDDSDQ
jgi:hypothetical protein